MRAKDLGFVGRCKPCLRQIQIGFQGQGPTASNGSPINNESARPGQPCKKPCAAIASVSWRGWRSE
jgi:hypothetical protein